MSDQTFISHVPEIKLSHEFENIDLVSDEDDALVEEKGSQLLRSDRFKKGPGSDISSDGSDFDMADPDKVRMMMIDAVYTIACIIVIYTTSFNPQNLRNIIKKVAKISITQIIIELVCQNNRILLFF